MSLIIMFDLENTLIDSWNSGCVLFKKVSFIKKKIKDLTKDTQDDVIFGVFSFACDLPNDKPKAIKHAEFATEVSIDPNFVVSWNELENLCKFRTDSLQKWEIVNLFGKHGMFDMWTREFPEHSFILFDDALPDKFNTMVRDNQTIIKVRV